MYYPHLEAKPMLWHFLMSRKVRSAKVVSPERSLDIRNQSLVSLGQLALTCQASMWSHDRWPIGSNQSPHMITGTGWPSPYFLEFVFAVIWNLIPYCGLLNIRISWYDFLYCCLHLFWAVYQMMWHLKDIIDFMKTSSMESILTKLLKGQYKH